MAERPFECSGCRKSIAISYTEIVGKTQQCQEMCADCPAIKRRLREGSEIVSAGNENVETSSQKCPNCACTLEAIQMGGNLGCAECYETFRETLVGELISAGKVGAGLGDGRVHHTGRAPGQASGVNPALHLMALKEALSEALEREDYEQAAKLRDQIKGLEGDSDGEH